MSNPGQEELLPFDFLISGIEIPGSTSAAPHLLSEKMLPQEFLKNQNQILLSKSSKLIALKIILNAVFAKWPQSNPLFKLTFL